MHEFAGLLIATSLLGLGGPVISTVLPKLVSEGFDGPARTRCSTTLDGRRFNPLSGQRSILLPTAVTSKVNFLAANPFIR